MASDDNPFIFLEYIYNKTRYPDAEEKRKYNPFIMNRGMSQHVDLIFICNALNQMWSLPIDIQFDFAYYGIKKGRRGGKWAKKDDSYKEKIDLIMQAYGYSEQKAKEIIPLIDALPDGWKVINTELYQGGTKRPP